MVSRLIRTMTLLGVAAGVALWGSSAPAQRSAQPNSGTTSSGLFGSRSIGGGSITPSGSSLFGGTGASSSSGTRGSALGSSATTQQLQAGSITGSERFINANRDATSSFVGVDVNEVRGVGTVGAQGTQSRRGLQNQFGSMNQLRQFDMLRQQFQNFNNLGQQGRTQVRVGLTLGFTPTAAASTPATATIAQRLPRLPGVNLVGSPQLTMVGRTAVVRGVAASERDRELVSRLLLLEPGIGDVQNEMTVAQGGGTPGSTPGSRPAAAPPEPPPAPPQS